MSYRIAISKSFRKAFNKLTAEEKECTANKIKILAENPLHPSLRVKKIKGSDGLFECSVSMDIRIIWYYENTTLILLLDIGHHNILNKY